MGGGLARRGGSMQDRFGAELLDRFRASGGVADSWYSAERFAIGYRRSAGGAVSWAFLGTLYAECAGLAGDRRDALLARYVARMTEPVTVPTRWAEAAPLLRPLLYGTAQGRWVPGAPRRPEAELLRRPALPLLDEVVVVDLPTTIGYVSTDLVASWGVSASEVFATAAANLAGVPGDQAAGRPSGAPALLRFVDNGSSYWVSRLLLDGWLAGFEARLGARPVAFAPDRDCLLVVADGPRLADVFDLVAAEFRGASRPLSPAGYTVDDIGRVVPYRPPLGHPAHHAAMRADRWLAAEAYDVQADLLRAHWPVAQQVSVASYLLAEPVDGAAPSVSTWRQDVATLLPETDQVALVGADRRQSWLVRWSELVRVVAPLRVPGLAPPRYRVQQWPRGEQLRVLLAGAAHQTDGAHG